MNSLGYLLVHEMKNRLFELRRKPGKLVLYLIVIGLLVFVTVNSLRSPGLDGGLRDITWLKGILMALFLFTLIASIKLGFSKGTTLFKMEDVNLLFVSPLKPQAILLFGVSRMMRTTLLSCFFILFNTGNLRNFFGIGFGGIFVVFAAFVLSSAVSQLLSLVIYSLTNSKPRQKRMAKFITAAVFLPMAISAVLHLISVDFDFAAAALPFLRSPAVSFTPIAGWAAAGTVALLTGQYAAGTLFFGLMALSGVFLVAIMYIGNPDYYEDVLVATETAFEKLRTVSEGQVGFEAISDKKVRVKATGVGGFGASVLFSRHVREAFRASRFGLWGLSTPILVVGAAAFSLIMTRTGSGDGVLLSLFISVMILQMFLAGLGRGIKDTYTHYIYLIPESPLKKILWSNLEYVFKTTVQNTLIFLVSGLIARESAAVILAAIVACSLFSFVLVGITYVYIRIVGASTRGGLLMIIDITTTALVMLPGIVGAIIAASLMGGWGLLAALIVLAVWELIAGLICFSAAKGIIHNCDMPNVPQFGQG